VNRRASCSPPQSAGMSRQPLPVCAFSEARPLDLGLRITRQARRKPRGESSFWWLSSEGRLGQRTGALLRHRPAPRVSIAFFWAPMRRNLFRMAPAGIPNFSAATDGSRMGLHDGSIARELIRRRFAQPRPHRLSVHLGALGICGGSADWDLFVFVISDFSATPKPAPLVLTIPLL
jgi:hypothetical protein